MDVSEENQRHLEDRRSCEVLLINKEQPTGTWKVLYEQAGKKEFRKYVALSSHMGELCYTRPDLCTSGFSVRIDVEGKCCDSNLSPSVLVFKIR